MNQNKGFKKNRSNTIVNYLSLFTSSGTIFCCALPALLVSIGAGASLSSLIGIFPQLVILSVYKVPVFIGAFIMLMISGVMQYHARSLPCPVDKEMAKLCSQTRKLSLTIFYISVGIFLIGFIFAFIIPFFMKSS
tara:strand:+ start:1136 stop:1540 length:405 start_codon:yes stop_codon:yes gene_type:complete